MDVSPPNLGLSPAARAACAAWFGPVPPEVGPSPGIGFSGAALAVVRPRGTAAWFVLKSFPADTERGRADWVHFFVRHLAASGIEEVPRPVPTPAGDTVVTDPAGTHWELVPLVHGTATDAPTDAQAAAALEMLARVHLAAARLPGVPPSVGQSAGVVHMIDCARSLASRPWRLRRAAAATDFDALTAAVAERWDRAIALVETRSGERAVASVARARPAPVPLHAVLRDVWSAHVLFADGGPARVAGIVDAHAAAIDTPALDVGRLLCSWQRRRMGLDAEPVPSAAALAAYEAVRPLQAAERAIVSLVRSAGVLLGLDTWFRWTLEERRRFPSPAAAVARIDWLLAALPAALDSLT